MTMSESVRDALKSELLCIADSNWVLGHWYINCMLNGRELTDFTSMAGIAEDKLGHTRALFRFMEEYFELPEYQLEFGRSVEQIHSMELLDGPPQHWADFILTLYLADAAIWRFSAVLREGSFAPVSNLITKFGEEAYFHQLCIDGWLKALDEPERDSLRQSLTERLPLVFAWIKGVEPDPLLDAGIRTQELSVARTTLEDSVFAKLADVTGAPADELRRAAVSDQSDPWDTRRRRTEGTIMPPRLWESIVPTSDEALLARRPLAVSVDDNIDLFGAVKRDETEPQF
jgi:ring-1,2-phenylacetyl-CoA epoxidase subunit PaaC